MKQGSFELSIEIARPPQDILALLSNFKRHTEIHPLIVSVKERDAPSGIIRRYKITDQLPFGPFRFKIEYRADILRLTDDEIYTEAYQAPQTYVYNLTHLSPIANGTRLTENTTLKTSGLLFNYAFKEAQNAHKEMLQRIKHLMEIPT
jgi:hypothetical protein